MEKLGKGCSITREGTTDAKDHSRTWVRLAVVLARDGWIPFAHANCPCNQRIAVVNRVLGATPEPVDVPRLKSFVARVCRRLPKIIPDDIGDMPNRYTGSKRARYQLAASQLAAGGVSRKHARVTMFVKSERLNPTKVNPDPRAIQFRTAIYCVALGRYLKPLEHYLYEMHGDGKLLPPTRVIGKGLNQKDRAMLLKAKMERFTNVVVLPLDASRFDKHVSRELLEVEHMVYKAMCTDVEFAKLLSWQLDNRCRTSSGMTYTTRGKRMSGDMNTALGNCVLMVMMVSCFMQGRKFDVLDDGDDCLLIIEESDLAWVLDNIGRCFLGWGMVLKVEGQARCMEEVEWCQSRPIRVGLDEWKFVRNPMKVLSTALSGFKYVESSIKLRRKLLHSIGQCELVLNEGVPVLQEFALAVIRNSGTNELLQFDSIDSLYYRLEREGRTRGEAIPVTQEARESFAKAFGISIPEQRAWEQWFQTWTFSITGDESYPVDIDSVSWKRPFGLYTSEVYSPEGNAP